MCHAQLGYDVRVEQVCHSGVHINCPWTVGPALDRKVVRRGGVCAQIVGQARRLASQTSVVRNIDDHRDLLSMASDDLRFAESRGAQHFAEALLRFLNLPALGVCGVCGHDTILSRQIRYCSAQKMSANRSAACLVDLAKLASP